MNAKLIDKFKDETNSIPPEEFVGLRAKIYSLKCLYPKMTAEKIKKSYTKRHVRHSAFVDALCGKQQSSTARFKTFKSVNHVVSTVDIEKIFYPLSTRSATFYPTASRLLLMDIFDYVICEHCIIRCVLLLIRVYKRNYLVP